MKILVISDTHGRRDRIGSVLSLHQRADALLFLGDGVRDLPSNLQGEGRLFAGVRGNCDGFSLGDSFGFSEELCLNLGTYTVLMTHGHRYSVKSGLDHAICHAAARGADLLLYGHTHVPEERYLPVGTVIGDTRLEKPLWIMNPGSLGAPLDGRPSFGVIEIQRGGILLSHGIL